MNNQNRLKLEGPEVHEFMDRGFNPETTFYNRSIELIKFLKYESTKRINALASILRIKRPDCKRHNRD